MGLVNPDPPRTSKVTVLVILSFLDRTSSIIDHIIY